MQQSKYKSYINLNFIFSGSGQNIKNLVGNFGAICVGKRLPNFQAFNGIIGGVGDSGRTRDVKHS